MRDKIASKAKEFHKLIVPYKHHGCFDDFILKDELQIIAKAFLISEVKARITELNNTPIHSHKNIRMRKLKTKLKSLEETEV